MLWRTPTRGAILSTLEVAVMNEAEAITLQVANADVVDLVAYKAKAKPLENQRIMMAPPAGFEPALPPPEGGALSPELRGPLGRHTAT